MASPAVSPIPIKPWKRLAIISFVAGAGFAIFVALIVGGFFWYSSRPKPPKPWDTNALVVSGSPGFDVRRDGRAMRFLYSVENRTSVDYHIQSATDVKLVIKGQKGTLSPPLPDKVAVLTLPVFIPSKQKGTLILSVMTSSIPEKGEKETDQEYHEKIRLFCNGHFPSVAGFAVFDEANRYQINLPKWLEKRPD